ncbi:hypothetical protein ACJ41O_010523 [Fusarium nematophilum]
MPNKILDLQTVDTVTYPYIFEQNVTVPLKCSDGLVRLNVFRPKTDVKVPVLVTYGPYGKDIPYKDFALQSWTELNPEHRSTHSAWETPDPGFWTSHGYAVVRADERGTGQSPGLLDTMSRSTSDAFVEVIEWCAEQPWSSGKIGLLGISYFAGTQWRVAARQPKGLAAIIPWEGMSDYYRDRCRHGGILSNKFIEFWWNRQGDLTEEERERNRQDQTVDNVKFRFLDDDYYATKDFNLADIKVPLLSVANWGGILLHLRGNVNGFIHAGSELKYLRFIVGRHDLPFYYSQEVDIQKSFLDAFLKGEDRDGWSKGKLPPVDLVLRKGDVGFNNPEAEQQFKRRTESQWPISRTKYTRYYLTPDRLLVETAPPLDGEHQGSYRALGTIDHPELIQFTTSAFEEETEITGHIVAHLSVSASKLGPDQATEPSDIDLFVTLRYISPSGQEVHYTGTAGDPIPLCKGWLRVSEHRNYVTLPIIPPN